MDFPAVQALLQKHMTELRTYDLIKVYVRDIRAPFEIFFHVKKRVCCNEAYSFWMSLFKQLEDFGIEASTGDQHSWEFIGRKKGWVAPASLQPVLQTQVATPWEIEHAVGR